MAQTEVPFNLVGFGIGNGCTGTDVGPCSPGRPANTLDMLYQHSMMSEQQHSNVKEQCADSQSLTTPSQRCVEELMKASDQVGPYMTYDVYADCGAAR